MSQFHVKLFMVRQASAVRPYSVTENLRGKLYYISQSNFRNFASCASRVFELTFYIPPLLLSARQVTII